MGLHYQVHRVKNNVAWSQISILPCPTGGFKNNNAFTPSSSQKYSISRTHCTDSPIPHGCFHRSKNLFTKRLSFIRLPLITLDQNCENSLHCLDELLIPPSCMLLLHHLFRRLSHHPTLKTFHLFPMITDPSQTLSAALLKFSKILPLLRPWNWSSDWKKLWRLFFKHSNISWPSSTRNSFDAGTLALIFILNSTFNLNSCWKSCGKRGSATGGRRKQKIPKLYPKRR